MRNEKLGKLSEFGDPRSINKCAAHEKPPEDQFSPTPGWE